MSKKTVLHVLKSLELRIIQLRLHEAKEVEYLKPIG